MTKKRAHGEGSIYKRSFTRKDGTSYERWVSELDMGYQGGKRVRKTIYGKTQQEVKNKLEEGKRQLTMGTVVDEKLSVGDFLEQWLQETRGRVKPKTTETYSRVVRKHLKPRLGHFKLFKLAPLQVQSAVNDIAKNSGVRTANQARTVLGTAMKQAVRWQLTVRNPVEAVTSLKSQKREMKLWQPFEAAHFLDIARENRLFFLFYLVMSTGMRRGEALGLRWQDIKGLALTVSQTLVQVEGKITVSTPKTVKGQRRVTLTPDVLSELELHRNKQQADRKLAGIAWTENDLVFTTQLGTPLHPRNLERTWYTLQDKAREKLAVQYFKNDDSERLKKLHDNLIMPRIRFHDLRHLNVSFRIMRGQDASEVAEQVGHARASFTQDVYTHLFEEQRQRAGISLLEFLPSRPEGSQSN